MTVQVLHGDCREVLRTLEPESVHCVVTSPPYFGLRAYLPDGHPDKHLEIGLEKSPDEYIAELVAVFAEVRRVLRKDGTVWLNLGDSYCSTDKWGGGGNTGKQTIAGDGSVPSWHVRQRKPAMPGHKPKDLMLMPFRVADALQAPRYTGRLSSEIDRAWLAAIIDGEGCIYIAKQPIGTLTGRGRQSLRTQDSFCAGISISNTSERLLVKCAGLFGKDNIRKIDPKDNRRAHYSWAVTGNVAKSILAEIYPYLVVKQKEARIAIGCPASGDLAEASWLALKSIHKGRPTDFDSTPPDATVLWEPGWYVRSDIIWAKKNCMPESVTDRPTSAHEHIFLLARSERYFFDQDAVREPACDASLARIAQPNFANQTGGPKDYGPDSNRSMRKTLENFAKDPGRNIRNVWTIATSPFSDWTKTVRRVRVEADAPADGKKRTTSPDCPLHGDRTGSVPSVPYGGRAAASSIRTGSTDGHLFPELAGGSVPTERPHEPATAEQSSDCSLPECLPSATPRSSRSRKTARAPETNPACNASAQTAGHTGDTSASPEPCGSAGRTPENSSEPDGMADHHQEQIAGHNAHKPSSHAPKCMCEYYIEIVEETSHFATFPPELAERCIKAGTSEKGCCPQCGTPWVRETNAKFIPQGDVSADRGVRCAPGQKPMDASNSWGGFPRGTTSRETVGWSPSCECFDHFEERDGPPDWISDETGERKKIRVYVPNGDAPPPKPCVVLDPFGGAGTTGLVADRLQRNAVLIELNQEYVGMAENRIRNDAPLLAI